MLPLTITQSAGYPAVVFGLLAAVNGVLVALFEISIVAQLKRFRRLRLAALGYALVAARLRHDRPRDALGLVPAGGARLHRSARSCSAPQQMAFIADWAPPEARGRYLSLYQATWSIAFAVNPALTLPLHAALGERAFWGLAPLVALPGVIVLLRLDAHGRPARAAAGSLDRLRRSGAIRSGGERRRLAPGRHRRGLGPHALGQHQHLDLAGVVERVLDEAVEHDVVRVLAPGHGLVEARLGQRGHGLPQGPPAVAEVEPCAQPRVVRDGFAAAARRARRAGTRRTLPRGGGSARRS